MREAWLHGRHCGESLSNGSRSQSLSMTTRLPLCVQTVQWRDQYIGDFCRGVLDRGEDALSRIRKWVSVRTSALGDFVISRFWPCTVRSTSRILCQSDLY
jgi:hypothetical protein